jgi:hypothetical protein
MEKKVVQFKKKANVEIDFYGEKVTVIPYIDAVHQSIFIERYLARYFDPKDNSTPGCRYAFADSENELKIAVIEELSNLELKDIDMIGLLVSGFFEKLVNVVTNWGEFKATLYQSVKIVEKERELQESVGGVISGLASKLGGLIDKLNEISPDELKQLVSDSQGLLKGLEQSPASQVFVESGKNKASKVQ